MKKIIIGLTLFLIIIVLGAGFFISGEVINLKSKDYLTTYNMEIKYKRFTEKYFKSLPKEDITIKSPYGYSMYALYIPYKNSKKTIIITHGRTYTHLGSIKYAKMFRSWGFNVLTPDSRYHGKTGGANATYGFYERYDMKAWVDWVQKKTGKKTKIGFHAESMSTAICILHGAIDNRASYYILDGSYTSLKEMLAYMLKKQYKLPSFPFLNIASGISKLKGAMYYDDLKAIDEINKIKVPIFFIHGGKDNYIPNSMSTELHKKYNGPKKIWLAPGSDHSKSFTDNPRKYYEKVKDFLIKYNLFK